jgi:hypothetical protein
MARLGKAIVAAALAVALLSYGIHELRRHQMRAAVLARAIAIEEVSPDWQAFKDSPGESPLVLSLVLRNTSDTAIHGTCVLRGVVDHRALQAGYIRGFVRFYREREDLRQVVDEWPSQNPNPKRRALLTALHRPGVLVENLDDEPVQGVRDPEYVFTFREDCDLPPGEIARMRHSQVLPNSELGFVFKIELVDLE